MYVYIYVLDELDYRIVCRSVAGTSSGTQKRKKKQKMKIRF